MKLSQYARKNSITYRTAWSHYKTGRILCERTKTGGILVVDETKQRSPYTVVYTRVSSSENKKNLATQRQRVVDFCNAKGWIVNDVIEEVGSGLNEDRKKLNKILTDNKATRIVVEHKDRLTRFGFNYIKMLCDANHCELVVINQTDSEKEDLIQDFVSVITSFCARIYGQRRTKRKTERLIRELETGND